MLTIPIPILQGSDGANGFSEGSLDREKKTLPLVRYHLSRANRDVSGPENMQILEMFIDPLSKNQCI